MNRLANETSPYLLQHAGNPVDWWPWCAEAFEDARLRDVPVMLSIGYSACHWCHVMAHESFEDASNAEFLNANFVCIKVDREERPDIDAIYIDATVRQIGQAGWPLTCFLTPDAKPFYCGTYFPPENHLAPDGRLAMPSFRTIFRSVAHAWVNDRESLERSGAEAVAELSRMDAGRLTLAGDQASEPSAPTEVVDAGLLDAAVAVLHAELDTEYGGVGRGAPKFPPSPLLEFLLHNAARNGPDSPALEVAELTLEKMARGGIYDQLGGGFARYSVDRYWDVPHFEKMLYDNAQLLFSYIQWHKQTGSPLALRIAKETADFLIREMRTPEGAFAASIDADSEGVEGKFYVWSPAELEEFDGAAELFAVGSPGTFEEGTSALRLPADPLDEAAFDELREALLEKRDQRVRPGRDDKVVAGWNGLAISALAEAGIWFGPEYLRAAVDAADFLVRRNIDARHRITRTSRNDVSGNSAGVLEDYAFVANAFLRLHSTTADPRWLTHAEGLLEVVRDQFLDDNGGFFDTPADGEALIKRPRDPADGPASSGYFAAAGAFLSYAAITGSEDHRRIAEGALRMARLLAERMSPRACGSGLAVAEAWLQGPLEIAIVGDKDDPMFVALHRTALRSSSPGAVVVFDRDLPPVDGRATAYVCRRFVCDRPVTDPVDLDERISPWRGVNRDRALDHD